MRAARRNDGVPTSVTESYTEARMRRAFLIVAAAALLAGCERRPETWFRPNIGSTDMLELFTHPEAWARARDEVDVFGFYAAQVASSAPCPQCGPNRLENFSEAGAFTRLREWGLPVDIEVPAIKPGDCAAASNTMLTLDAIRSLRVRGVPPRHVSMDEPLFAAISCGLPDEIAVARTAAFVARVRSEPESPAIGDVEPYPALTEERTIAWLDALGQVGAKPAFFHLDVDRAQAAHLKIDVAAALRTYQAALASRRIPFGVIFWGDDGTSDAAYAANVLSWTSQVANALGGAPPHVLFQSWAMSPDGTQHVPTNLPDDDPTVPSHTRIIREGVALLR